MDPSSFGILALNSLRIHNLVLVADMSTRSQAELDNNRLHTVALGQACTCVPVNIQGSITGVYICKVQRSQKSATFSKPELEQ